jgi:hypothetical protein
MPDADAFLSPEPNRFMYDSDEEHVRAWLAWAEQTPGGWRARLADKRRATGAVATDEAEGCEIPAGRQRERRYLVRHIEATSPCCACQVIVDPLSSIGRLGLCSACGTMLRYRGTTWQRRAEGRRGE